MKEKFKSTAECGRLTEYKMLKAMRPHPNIVQLYDTFLSSSNELYFVMEYLDFGNLYQFINERKVLNKFIELEEIKSILYQMLAALSHIHYKEHIFHRDIKPENLLISISNDGSLTLKLADFGLAKCLNSRPPFTDYVSTRWYRAPEVLLKSNNYSYPIDLWAVGTIFAELITLDPLFPGQSEVDQLYRIFEVLGSPGTVVKKKKSRIDLLSSSIVYSSPPSIIGLGGEWKEGVKLAQKLGFQFPRNTTPFGSFLHILNSTSVPSEGIDLLTSLLKFDPCKRIDSTTALSHSFFAKKNDQAQLDLPDIPPISPLMKDEPRFFDFKIAFDNIPQESLLSRTISSPILYTESTENTLNRRSMSDLSINLHQNEKISKFHKLSLWAKKCGLTTDKF
ncbi:hypothetical protein G6F22_008480 [Rhizopus arrhizus]|nr:hypothetical protein G6F22_008480 [Rhizopus arrhizus]